MATFKAFDSFISLNFNLSAIHSSQNGFQFYDNANKVIDCKTYQDVAGLQFKDYASNSTFYFCGTGPKFDVLNYATAGKLTSFFMFGGNVGDLTHPLYALEGVHISAVALDAAAGASAAHDTTDRIIYNTSSGVLYYDPDGMGGEAAAQFATLASHPALVANDIMLALY